LLERGVEIIEDDLGRPCVRREVLGELLQEERERLARIEAENAARAAAAAVPVAGGLPAIEGGSAMEAIAAGDPNYSTPRDEFAGRERPNFLAAEIDAGNASTGRCSSGGRRQEGGSRGEPMTTTLWVRPKGPAPPPGTTKIRVQLAQNVDGRPHGRWLHTVGEATIYRGGAALLKLIDTEAGRVAAEMVREDMIDAVFWGSRPTLRLR
jgi:hypothetical protein